MCVREYVGYMCGHCSVPYLHQCPLSLSNPNFPPCKFPAERPLFFNENCHPCSRIVWNAKILKDEEIHRAKHQNGECECEVIFDATERERRMRHRGGKAKKGKDIYQTTRAPANSGETVSGEDSMGPERRFGGPHQEYSGVSTEQDGYDQNYGYEHNGGNFEQGHYRYEFGGGSQKHRGHTENFNEHVRAGWDPKAQVSAYEYVGYYISGDDAKTRVAPEIPRNEAYVDVDQVAKGRGFPDNGQVPRDYLWNGALQMGQPGAGMRWYTEQLNVMPALPPPSPLAERTLLQKTPRIWQKSMSEPADTKSSYQNSPATVIATLATVTEKLATAKLDDSKEMAKEANESKQINVTKESNEFKESKEAEATLLQPLVVSSAMAST